jgi:hypothetical protein
MTMESGHPDEPLREGLARLAVETEAPPDLWERILTRARSGERAVLPMPDIDVAPQGQHEVAGRDADGDVDDEPRRDESGEGDGNEPVR